MHKKNKLLDLKENKSNKHDHVFTKDKLMQRYQYKQYIIENLIFYSMQSTHMTE